MPMSMSADGRKTLMAREGCRLSAYRDSVGVWTIGVGHTGRASPPKVLPGTSISMLEAETFLTNDLIPFETTINRVITRPMTQNQFDAMASLAFNIGASGFSGSTVVHKFNDGDVKAAAEAFLMWTHPPELKARRLAERAQFLAAPDAVPPPTSTAKHRMPNWCRQVWAKLAPAKLAPAKS